MLLTVVLADVIGSISPQVSVKNSCTQILVNTDSRTPSIAILRLSEVWWREC